MRIMSYYVYILQSLKTESYYTGSTQDISARLERHNQGRSKATKGKGPWQVVYSEQFETREEAVNRETEIKDRKSKSYVEKLVRASRQA